MRVRDVHQSPSSSSMLDLYLRRSASSHLLHELVEKGLHSAHRLQELGSMSTHRLQDLAHGSAAKIQNLGHDRAVQIQELARVIKARSRKQIAGFSSVTGINGFAFILDARVSLEKWFLIIALFTCAVMTLYDIQLTIGRYLEEESALQAKIVFGEKLVIADPTFCIPFSISQLLASEHIGRLSLAEAQQLLQNSADDMLAILASNGKDSNNILPLGHVNRSSQVQLIVTLAEMLTAMTGEMRQRQTSSGKQWQTTFCENCGQQSREALAISHMAHEHFVAKSAQFDQLLQLTGTALCQLLNVNVTVKKYDFRRRTHRQRVVSICKQSFVAFLGADPNSQSHEMICLRPLFEHMTLLSFRSILDKVVFEHSAQLVPSGSDRSSEHTGLYIYLDALPSLNTVQNQHVIIAPANQISKAELEHVSQLNSTNRKTTPCAEKGSVAQCHVTCSAAFVFNKFHCWPLRHFTLEARPSGVPFCSVEFVRNVTRSRYNLNSNLNLNVNLNLTEDVFAETTDCYDFCYDSCLVNVFSFQVMKKHTPNNYFGGATNNNGNLLQQNNSTVVEIQARRLSWLQVTESLTLPDLYSLMQAILGNCGGSFIGASAIALVHLPVYFVRALLDKGPKRKVIPAITQPPHITSPKMKAKDPHSPRISRKTGFAGPAPLTEDLEEKPTSSFEVPKKPKKGVTFQLCPSTEDSPDGTEDIINELGAFWPRDALKLSTGPKSINTDEDLN